MSEQEFFQSEAFRALLKAIEAQYGKIESVTVCHLPESGEVSEETPEEELVIVVEGEEQP